MPNSRGVPYDFDFVEVGIIGTTSRRFMKSRTAFVSNPAPITSLPTNPGGTTSTNWSSKSPKPRTPPASPPTARFFPTIVAIITDFFFLYQRVVLYICDDSDSKELARKRKFDGWHTRLGDSFFEKYDLPTVTAGPERYFASVFFRRDNPYRLATVAAFERLVEGDK